MILFLGGSRHFGSAVAAELARRSIPTSRMARVGLPLRPLQQAVEETLEQ